MSHKQRQQRYLRRLLVKTGLELFSKDGYDETSIEDIVKQVGISPRTFFRYFRSKEDLLLSGNYDGAKIGVIELLHRPPSETPLQAMRGAFTMLAKRCDETREATLLRVRVIYGSQTLRAAQHYDTVRWEQEFLEAICKVRNAPESAVFNIRLQIGIATVAFTGAFDAWQADASERSLVYWLDEAFRTIADNIPV